MWLNVRNAVTRLTGNPCEPKQQVSEVLAVIEPLRRLVPFGNYLNFTNVLRLVVDPSSCIHDFLKWHERDAMQVPDVQAPCDTLVTDEDLVAVVVVNRR